MSRTTKWTLIVALLLAALPFAYFMPIAVLRQLADAKLEPICKNEGGLRIYEKVPLTPDQAKFLNTIPRSELHRRQTLFSAFEFRKDQTHVTMYGVPVTKYRLSLWRTADGKLLSEGVWFFRDGYYEYVQGRICPNFISNGNLVDATFVIPIPGA